MRNMLKFQLEDVQLWYNDFKALHGVSMDIEEKEITAFIGPSGCGKSTLLKCLNRMNDLVEGCHITGKLLLDGDDINATQDVNRLRRRVGMVFQKPNPFPMSIYDNIAFGPRTHGVTSRLKLDGIVEKALRDAAIWEETKDRLKKSALSLSGGQQQRLCIARALTAEPEVLLLDEPCSALDVKSIEAIEAMLLKLRETYTIILVTHNIAQARRIADYTAFFNNGRLVEFGEKDALFLQPRQEETKAFLSGVYG